MRRILPILLVFSFGCFLTGCQKSTQNREYVTENGQTTVVLDQTQAIFPKEAAAVEKKVIENYRAYDFLDNDVLVGYQFSKTVFGDDRGIWIYQLKEDKLGLRLEIEESPKTVSVSKDKAQMVVLPDKTGEYGNLLLMDLKNGAVKTFKAPPKSYFWQFNWQYDGSGLTGFDVLQGRTKIWRINKEGTLTASELGYFSKSYVEIENLQGTSTYLYYTLMGEASGLYRYDWKTKKSEALSRGHFIKRLRLSPSEDRFAVVDYKNNSQMQSLSIYGIDAKVNYEVFKSPLIEQVIWQPDGAGIVFTTVEKEGKLSVYRANLADGQLQYLGEYPNYSIESLAFSPDSSKLLITYINQGAKDPIWITHILTLSEGGTGYDQ